MEEAGPVPRSIVRRLRATGPVERAFGALVAYATISGLLYVRGAFAHLGTWCIGGCRADTMIYLGDLAPTLSGVANRLSAGGFFLFAVEAKDGTGWEHNDWKRFCHSEAYLREEAARAGLSFIDIMECVLRRQAHEPVRGLAVALQKPQRQAML